MRSSPSPLRIWPGRLVLKTETPWRVVCQPEFIEDRKHRVAIDRRTAARLLELVQAILRDPFAGIADRFGSAAGPSKAERSGAVDGPAAEPGQRQGGAAFNVTSAT